VEGLVIFIRSIFCFWRWTCYSILAQKKLALYHGINTKQQKVEKVPSFFSGIHRHSAIVVSCRLGW
jgi:hypothetical protein